MGRPRHVGSTVPDSDPLLTASEVARWLRLKRGAVYKLASAGTLPAIRLATGTIRFRRRDVERVLAAHEVRS